VRRRILPRWESACRDRHLERLAGDERECFLDAVMVRLGERPLLGVVEHRCAAALADLGRADFRGADLTAANFERNVVSPASGQVLTTARGC
jgi:uncharacterized protein YjbI with pentapeptide repeats